MPWHLCFFLFFVQTTVLTSLSQYAWLRPRQPPDWEKMAMRLRQSIFDSPCLWMIDWAVLQMPLRDSSAAIISVSITIIFIFLLRCPLIKSIWQFLNSNISPRDYCRTYRKILGSILLIVIMVTSRPPHHLIVFMRIRRRINWVALYFGLHFIAVIILTPLPELDPYWDQRSESASDFFPIFLLPFLFFLVWYFWGFVKWCLICFKTKTKTKKKIERGRLRAI